MAVPVAIVDPLPMYRRGVVAVLSAAGHPVETPPDVLSWVRRPERTIVLLTLDSEPTWDVLRCLIATASGHEVIALVEEADTAGGVNALQVGARSVLWRTAQAPVLCRTVEATIDGQAVLPASVAVAVAAGLRPVGATGWAPPPDQMSWLRQLASGSTVVRLANQVGYSERAMFRLLRELYQQMGVTSRTEAIMRAHELGWLSQVPVRSG